VCVFSDMKGSFSLGVDLKGLISDGSMFPKTGAQHSPTLQQNFQDQGGGTSLPNFNGLSSGHDNVKMTQLRNNVAGDSLLLSDGDTHFHPDGTFSPGVLNFDGQMVSGQIQNHALSSPEYPNTSDSSPYNTDPNPSPYDSSVHFMETDNGVSVVPQSLNFSTDTTQSSLINGTDRLRLDSINAESSIDHEVKPKIELTDLDLVDKSGKVARMAQDSDASTASMSVLPSVDRVFNSEEAQQEVPRDFIFTKFGQDGDDPNLGSIFPFRSDSSDGNQRLV